MTTQMNQPELDKIEQQANEMLKAQFGANLSDAEWITYASQNAMWLQEVFNQTVERLENPQKSGLFARGERKESISRQSEMVSPEKLSNRSVVSAPWKHRTAVWSPSSIFYSLWEGNGLDLVIRIYDIATNFLGSLQMYAGDNPIAWGVLLIGAVVVSFAETIGLQAFAEFKVLSNVEPSADEFINQFRNKTKLFYLIVSMVCLALWVLDLILSALPWIALFGHDNPMGYVIGGALSVIVEYVELRAENRKLEEIANG